MLSARAGWRFLSCGLFEVCLSIQCTRVFLCACVCASDARGSAAEPDTMSLSRCNASRTASFCSGVFIIDL